MGGAMVGVALLLAFWAWLLTGAPSSARVGVAVLLAAWPVLLVTACAGYGVGLVVDRVRGSPARSRRTA
jgi:hypothetical protein